LQCPSLGDFEQPRELWKQVWDDNEREALVQNVAASLSAANATIKGNQRMSHSIHENLIAHICSLYSVLVFNAVDKQLAERIAQAMNFNFLSPPMPIEALKLNLKKIKKDVLLGGPS